MSIFHRISDILKANINDLLDRAEDPEKMVKQIIADMEEQVRDATEALGQAMASEKQAYAQLEKARSNSREWESKAKTALQAGNQSWRKRRSRPKWRLTKMCSHSRLRMIRSPRRQANFTQGLRCSGKSLRRQGRDRICS